jgi:hypothetical protein
MTVCVYAQEVIACRLVVSIGHLIAHKQFHFIEQVHDG